MPLKSCSSMCGANSNIFSEDKNKDVGYHTISVFFFQNLGMGSLCVNILSILAGIDNLEREVVYGNRWKSTLFVYVKLIRANQDQVFC